MWAEDLIVEAANVSSALVCTWGLRKAKWGNDKVSMGGVVLSMEVMYVSELLSGEDHI